jgi:uncharacterized protein (DUF58 family)
VLTNRGRWVLALGGLAYLAGWTFGSRPLYPVGVGLVLAVAVATGWVRLFRKPMQLQRRLARRQLVEGDDVPVSVQLDVEGRLPPGGVLLAERIARLGRVETVLRRTGRGTLRGAYVLHAVPRGRYPIETVEVVVEDPFGLARVELELPVGDAVLVYPRLVELDRLFSESGMHQLEGRRLLLHRPSGFDLHSVREYEQGESLRRVHWPSTAKRGQLMVKELEDAPRDETAVVLDAWSEAVVGTGPDSTFDVQVRAAGSILKAHARRGRRAALIVSAERRLYQPVHSYDGDWNRALELLASVEPDGHTPLATLLADEAGAAARALELTVVTASLDARLVDRLLQRSLSRHAATLVYVEPRSWGSGGGVVGARRPQGAVGARRGEAVPSTSASASGEMGTASFAPDLAAQLLRLRRGGVPVAVLRRGDDLAARLGGQLAGTGGDDVRARAGGAGGG